MRLWPTKFEITRRKQLPQSIDYDRGWLRIVESYTGAWPRNDDIPIQNVLSNTTVYRCVTLIAADIAKMRLRLMEEDSNGIGQEIDSAAFSPLLEFPNHYQNSIQFFEQWMFSKLINGNTYVLKHRDGRNVIDELYVLDPQRVRPLVAPDQSVYYELRRDDLSGLTLENIMVPAKEVIHDRMNALYHPLWGLSPIFASHLPAAQALRILKYSDKFFSNAARPSGMLTAPGVITQTTADRLKAEWGANFAGENQGKIAVAGDGLKFDAMAQNAVDNELLGQLKQSDQKVCTSFGVPGFKVGVEPPPAYDNIEALDQHYYSGCLQTHIESIERLMASGMELPSDYYVEFDLGGLLRMDTQRRTSSYSELVKAGILAPNEARAEFDFGPVDGGDSPYLQQQYYPLDKRPANAAPTPKPETPMPNPETVPAKEFHTALRVIRGGLN